MSETQAEIAIHQWSWHLHPIFARCVDPEMVKYDLSRPFVIDEYVYATNARLAVRMPTPDLWMIPNPEKCPPRSPLLDLFGDNDFSRWPWRQEPTHFPAVEGVCEVCLGAKVLPEMGCPYCGGQDSPRYQNVPDLCEECWELEGKIPAGPCYDCGGSGILDSFGRLEVTPGYWLQRQYVALLHEFEMTTYLPVELAPGKVTRFTQGDVTGVLMPMTAPDARRGN